MALVNKARKGKGKSFGKKGTNYVMKITQIHDQLVVGEKLADAELVSVALNVFTKPWDSFIKGLCAWKKLLNWEMLWDD